MPLHNAARAGTAALLVVVSLATASQAAAPLEPVALITKAYRDLNADHIPSESLYTPRLKALVAGARKQAAGEAPCGLDYVFWVDAQDVAVTDLTVVRTPTPDPQRASVTATFKNVGVAQEMIFDLRRMHGRWLLNDVQSLGESKWTWSTVLQCKS